MASITFRTYLMHKATDAWENVCPIKTYPAPRPEKETVESTTMSDAAHTYVPGLINQEGNLEFTINLEKTNITKIRALEGKDEEYAIFMDESDNSGVPKGDLLKFGGHGEAFLAISEGEVNGIREGTVVIYPSDTWDFLEESK